jgi:hypothetical protein
MVESWATELASVGSNVVELTSSIRVSPLIDKNIRSDDGNVDYKLGNDITNETLRVNYNGELSRFLSPGLYTNFRRYRHMLNEAPSWLC